MLLAACGYAATLQVGDGNGARPTLPQPHQTLVPTLNIAPAIGLASSAGSALPAPFSNGMFIGQHGSWNRRPRSGYKVIFVPFSNGMPADAPIDVLTGFLNEEGKAHGRPVVVVVDKRGALLVGDDVGNVVWRASGLP